MLRPVYLVVSGAAFVGALYWGVKEEFLLMALSFANGLAFLVLQNIARAPSRWSSDTSVCISTTLLYLGAFAVTTTQPYPLYQLFYPSVAIGPALLASRAGLVIQLSILGLALSAVSLWRQASVGPFDWGLAYVVQVAWFAVPVVWLARSTILRAHEEQSERKRQESLQQVCAGVAHSLNNLLQRILATAELTLSKEPEEAHSWNQVVDSVKSGAIIGKAMGLYAGSSHISRSMLHAAQLSEDLLRICQPAPEWLKFELIKSDTPVFIRAERELLAIGLSSIVQNALEAVEDSQVPSVVVRFSFSSDVLFIDFRDNGMGIPQSSMAQVFDPFFSTKGLGPGLGLSFALGVINRHGGRISVHGLDPGTEVNVWLPRYLGESVTTASGQRA